ncbi:MAG: helix-turn-helix domain-containing protein [Hespellia sp.]|nr:helix-turn-helix domain-containing protein [Hespellia sp.]
MDGFVWQTAEEINKDLASRVKKIRKRRKITQQELSQRSGVSYGSIKRFETTGNISLLALTRISIALDCVNEIKELFGTVPYENLEEVIRERKQCKTKQRKAIIN